MRALIEHPTQRRARRPAPLAPGGLRAACWLVLLCLFFRARMRQIFPGLKRLRTTPPTKPCGQREGAHRPKGAAPAALQTPRPQPETRPCSCYDSTRDWSTQDKAASGLRASTSCSASWQTTSSTAPSRIGARARGPAFARGGPCDLTAPCARAQDTHEITQGQGTPPVPSRTASRDTLTRRCVRSGSNSRRSRGTRSPPGTGGVR